MDSKVTKRQFEEAFEAAVKQDNLCIVGRLIHDHEFGPEIKAKVDDEVHYSGAVIARVLKSVVGTVTSAESISKHRRGLCRCV